MAHQMLCKQQILSRAPLCLCLCLSLRLSVCLCLSVCLSLSLAPPPPPPSPLSRAHLRPYLALGSITLELDSFLRGDMAVKMLLIDLLCLLRSNFGAWRESFGIALLLMLLRGDRRTRLFPVLESSPVPRETLLDPALPRPTRFRGSVRGLLS